MSVNLAINPDFSLDEYLKDYTAQPIKGIKEVDPDPWVLPETKEPTVEDNIIFTKDAELDDYYYIINNSSQCARVKYGGDKEGDIDDIAPYSVTVVSLSSLGDFVTVDKLLGYLDITFYPALSLDDDEDSKARRIASATVTDVSMDDDRNVWYSYSLDIPKDIKVDKNHPISVVPWGHTITSEYAILSSFSSKDITFKTTLSGVKKDEEDSEHSYSWSTKGYFPAVGDKFYVTMLQSSPISQEGTIDAVYYITPDGLILHNMSNTSLVY